MIRTLPSNTPIPLTVLRKFTPAALPGVRVTSLVTVRELESVRELSSFNELDNTNELDIVKELVRARELRIFRELCFLSELSIVRSLSLRGKLPWIVTVGPKVVFEFGPVAFGPMRVLAPVIVFGPVAVFGPVVVLDPVVVVVVLPPPRLLVRSPVFRQPGLLPRVLLSVPVVLLVVPSWNVFIGLILRDPRCPLVLVIIVALTRHPPKAQHTSPLFLRQMALALFVLPPTRETIVGPCATAIPERELIHLRCLVSLDIPSAALAIRVPLSTLIPDAPSQKHRSLY